MKHPHDKIIRAWLDGEVIQYYSPSNSQWLDIWGMERFEGDGFFNVPTFPTNYEFRIKPKTTTVTHKYRRFCWRSSLDQSIAIGTCIRPRDPTMVSYTLRSISESTSFIKWIDDDWVTETYEVEVPS